MKIIEAAEVFDKLTMKKCMELMRTALTDLESGKALQPIRSINKLPHDNSFGFMPAYLGDQDYFGAKIITAFHKNLGTKYPSHMGYVMMFESEHGSVVGLADAGAITQIRTGAVSGVATDLLAVADASSLALIGAGAQARSHLEAILLIRDIREVTVYDIKQENAERFCKEMGEKFRVNIRVCKTVEEAVKDADIICTLTPSKEAYLKAEWVKPGAHVNAVGTFTPTTREVTSELVVKSKLYADQVEAMKKESGEFLIPKQDGLIDDNKITGSIGEVLSGIAQGRTGGNEITLFIALGLAVEDVTCGKYLCSLE
jgi:ornithine cyclodeaminase